MIPQRGVSSPFAVTAKKVKSGSFHFRRAAFTSSNSLFLFNLSASCAGRQTHCCPAAGAFNGIGHTVFAPQSSESKSLASFLSATCEDLTSFFRCHSCAETAFTVSAEYGRLIRSFHFSAFPKSYLYFSCLFSNFNPACKDGLYKIAQLFNSSSHLPLFLRFSCRTML